VPSGVHDSLILFQLLLQEKGSQQHGIMIQSRLQWVVIKLRHPV
jgi:hypothetical protein